MQRATISGLVVLSFMLLAGIVVVVFTAPPSRTQVFVYATDGTGLTEPVALHFAVRAVREYDPAFRPTPVADDRAADGEMYLLRNAVDPNSGMLMFEDSATGDAIYISVTAEGTSIRCVVARGR
jgi:hypothetical protein